jgi:hypothetical protein
VCTQQKGNRRTIVMALNHLRARRNLSLRLYYFSVLMGNLKLTLTRSIEAMYINCFGIFFSIQNHRVLAEMNFYPEPTASRHSIPFIIRLLNHRGFNQCFPLGLIESGILSNAMPTLILFQSMFPSGVD